MSRMSFVTFEQQSRGGGTLFVTTRPDFDQTDTTKNNLPVGTCWHVEISGFPPKTPIKRVHNDPGGVQTRVLMGEVDSTGKFIYSAKITPTSDQFNYDSWWATRPGTESGYPTDAPNDIDIGNIRFFAGAQSENDLYPPAS